MKGILAVLYREYRFRRTNLTFLFWDVFVPIAYLLIFGYGFQQSLGGSFVDTTSNADYASFFLAGILTMTSFSIAMNTSWRFFTERENGIFYEVLTYPISRQELVIGKILFNILLSVAGSYLAIACGILVLGIQIKPELTLWTVLGLCIGTAGWFFFFTILALRIRRIDVFNTVTSICYIIMMFTSSLFYPLEHLPQWFRFVARLNPMTWQTDILRYSTLGTGEPWLLIWEGLAYLAFTCVCFGGALQALNRAGE
jgi:ABC-2 type transport system permease protein